MSSDNKTQTVDKTASVRDVPVSVHAAEKFSQERHDALNTFSYAKALGEFIEKCDTPITIGIQGEWGSGKTSLLNMIEVYLKGKEADRKRAKQQSTCTISINTWEHSLLRGPEETLLSIIREIIQEIGDQNGGNDPNMEGMTTKTLRALKAIGKGAFYSAVTMTAGFKVADEIKSTQAEMAGGGDKYEDLDKNLIKELRQNLEQLVQAIHDDETETTRFVVFVDDLDRLEPATAVRILELLKNIFEIPNTIFVLAIDYQVVVKGLRSKFGEPTEENEWEFRAFFDKIIQVPFLMPMASYQLDEYIKQLLTGIQYISGTRDEGKYEQEKAVFTEIVRKTVGTNPRALKRLTNSLSLIKLKEGPALKEFSERYLLFAFICFQIGFPSIFELLLLNSDYTSWTDEGAKRFIRSKGKDPNPPDFESALSGMMHSSDSYFNGAEWHNALFRVVWTLKWQRKRIVEAITVLELITNSILRNNPMDRAEKIEAAIRMAATTSVIPLDGSSKSEVADESDGPESDKQLRNDYWMQFKSHTSSIDIWSGIRDTATAGRLVQRAPDMDGIYWSANVNSSQFIGLQGSGEDVRGFFQYLNGHVARLTNVLQQRQATFSMKYSSAESGDHHLFISPSIVESGVALPKDDAQRAAALAWLSENFEGIRKQVVDQWNNYRSGGPD